MHVSYEEYYSCTYIVRILPTLIPSSKYALVSFNLTRSLAETEQVDILNQVLQILYLKHHVYKTL